MISDKKRLDWILSKCIVTEMGVTLVNKEMTEEDKIYSIDMIDCHIEVQEDEECQNKIL